MNPLDPSMEYIFYCQNCRDAFTADELPTRHGTSVEQHGHLLANCPSCGVLLDATEPDTR